MGKKNGEPLIFSCTVMSANLKDTHKSWSRRFNIHMCLFFEQSAPVQEKPSEKADGPYSHQCTAYTVPCRFNFLHIHWLCAHPNKNLPWELGQFVRIKRQQLALADFLTSSHVTQKISLTSTVIFTTTPRTQAHSHLLPVCSTWQIRQSSTSIYIGVGHRSWLSQNLIC